jgi:hypothetical protein
VPVNSVAYCGFSGRTLKNNGKVKKMENRQGKGADLDDRKKTPDNRGSGKWSRAK